MCITWQGNLTILRVDKFHALQSRCGLRAYPGLAPACSSLFRGGHLLSLYNLNQFVTCAIPRVKRIGFLFKKHLSEFLNGLVLFCYMIMEIHSNCLISDFWVGESVIFSWNSITQTFLLSVRCSAKTIVKFGCFSSKPSRWLEKLFFVKTYGEQLTYQQIKAELQLLTSLFFVLLFLALLTSGSSVLWQLFLNLCVKCLAI